MQIRPDVPVQKRKICREIVTSGLEPDVQSQLLILRGMGETVRQTWRGRRPCHTEVEGR